jgi:hypothetical protein
MDSTEVNRQIRALVRPILKASGFAAFTSRSAWRYRDDRIEVVNFQSFNDHLASGLRCTTYSFALNLGIYLLSVPEGRPPKVRGGRLAPEEYTCHLRRQLSRTLNQPELARNDIWYIDPEGRYLGPAVHDAGKAISGVGFTWFEHYGNPQALLAALIGPGHRLDDGTHLPGNPDSPARNRVTGYVARAMGQNAFAARHLARALEQYREIDAENAKLRGRMPALTPAGLAEDVAALAHSP